MLDLRSILVLSVARLGEMRKTENMKTVLFELII